MFGKIVLNVFFLSECHWPHGGYTRRPVHHPPRDHQGDLIFSVEDTGTGIPLEFHQAIFDAFRQQNGHISKQFGGTGLGLSITKRLVEMMGGSITVKSEPEKGSTFEIV